jgi:hypothetical protein
MLSRALIAGLATCGRTAWKTFLPFPRARTRQDDDEHEHEDIEHLGCWDGRRHDRDPQQYRGDTAMPCMGTIAIWCAPWRNTPTSTP